MSKPENSGLPTAIHVVCPRGHRIGTVTVREHPREGLRIGMTVKGLRGVWADVYEHQPDTEATVHQVDIKCAHRRCRYTGHFNYSTLAAGLADALEHWRTEYRLPS